MLKTKLWKKQGTLNLKLRFKQLMPNPDQNQYPEKRQNKGAVITKKRTMKSSSALELERKGCLWLMPLSFKNRNLLMNSGSLPS